MTPDATGMTFIAKCLETIKGILINMPDDHLIAKLKVAAAQTHNLELLKYAAKQEDGVAFMESIPYVAGQRLEI